LCVDNCGTNYEYTNATDSKKHCKVSCPDPLWHIQGTTPARVLTTETLLRILTSTPNICATDCGALVKDNSTGGRLCVSSCGGSLYTDKTAASYVCVSVCPNTAWTDNQTKECLTTCDAAKFQ